MTDRTLIELVEEYAEASHAERIDTIGITDGEAGRLLTEIRQRLAAVEREACAKAWEEAHGFDKHGAAGFIRARS